MKTIYVAFILLVSTTIASCDQKKKPTNTLTEATPQTTATVKKDSVILSFSFVGCNRIDRHNTDTINNPSTANTYALQRIFDDVNAKENKPDLFFFLGDLVLAESTLVNLDTQLKAWKSLYEKDSISKSNIEMIAVPGNHEMLYSEEVSKDDWEEFPLKGSTDVWLQYMKEYMPAHREQAPNADGLDNRLTFAFTRQNVGFVVMNTDTYNPPVKTNPYGLGLEGQVPTDWVIDKINTYKKDSAIEHIFVLGHRPYYVGGMPVTDHGGLPAGPELWPAFQKAKVVAMLSAHVHDYERWQPINDSLGGGTYQIIAGNGGSVNNRHIPHSPPFFGYSTINVMSDGTIAYEAVGYCTGDTYITPVPKNAMEIRDKTTLTWEQNTNIFQYPYQGCN